MSMYSVATGQMLINWFVSAFPEDHYLRLLLTSQDLRILAVQFCTHLLAAGVIRQIPDKDVTLEPLFRVSRQLHNGE
jgi:formin 2